MITLYWCEQTRASRILWLLEELGEPFDVVRVDIRAEPRSDPAAFLAASPMGKVPAISDGEERLADSAAIALYLADTYPAAGLAPPPRTPGRAQYCFWMTYTPGVIEPAMAERHSGSEPNRFRSGWGDFGQMIDVIERGIAGREWLVGDRFSAADVMVGSSVLFMRQFGMLTDNPTLAGYADRCAARPAYQRARQRDG